MQEDKRMSKDELKFINDLTEKHDINFKQLLSLIGIGATRSADLFHQTGNILMEYKALDLDTDISRVLGVIPLTENIEGSDDFE